MARQYQIYMKLYFSIIFTLGLIQLNGQSSLSFDILEHNFGEISEESESVEVIFHFVNNGALPIRINGVKASCGCTTSGWTKEEVMPGDSGFVKAKYNPKNRPGHFKKSLRLTTTDVASNLILYISGFVKPKIKNTKEEFLIAFGDFRMKYTKLHMGKISTEKPIEKLFNIYNSSDTIAFLNEDDLILPDHIKISLVEGFLNPGESGQLKIVYDSQKKNDYGYVSDNIQFADTGDNLSVIAVIYEYFEKMSTEQLDNSPKLHILDKFYNFGNVTAGTIVKIKFELTNVGKEELLFRTIKSNCDCITYEINSKGIKQGKKQLLKILLDTSEMRGTQYKSITIYSNDPVAPTQIITLKGKIS